MPMTLDQMRARFVRAGKQKTVDQWKRIRSCAPKLGPLKMRVPLRQGDGRGAAEAGLRAGLRPWAGSRRRPLGSFRARLDGPSAAPPGASNLATEPGIINVFPPPPPARGKQPRRRNSHHGQSTKGRPGAKAPNLADPIHTMHKKPISSDVEAAARVNGAPATPIRWKTNEQARILLRLDAAAFCHRASCTWATCATHDQ